MVLRTWFEPVTYRSNEFHAFCNASEIAYGAVIYTRITDMYEKVTVTLLTGKAKVASRKLLLIEL